MLAELNGETDVSPSKFVRFKETVKALFNLTVEAIEAVNDETQLRPPTPSEEHHQEEQEA
jgi:hypothetical protein